MQQLLLFGSVGRFFMCGIPRQLGTDRFFTATGLAGGLAHFVMFRMRSMLSASLLSRVSHRSAWT